MKSIQVNNKEMFYQEKGEGTPVILGHSFLWDSNMWQPQLAFLSNHFHCIAPDLWGHGQSQGLDQKEYSIAQLADDYYAFISALGIKQCAIVGLSVGGMWGTQLALNHPDLVSHLVIMGSFVGPEPQQSQAEYFNLLSAIEKQGSITNEQADFIAPLFFSHITAKTKPRMVENLVKDLQSFTPNQIKTIVTLGRAIFGRKSLLDELPKLKQKVLVAVGADDGPRPPSESKLMADKIPGATLEIIPDAGHISNLEQPERVNQMLFDFLR